MVRGLDREGNGTPLQYSCLENPMDGGAWWAAVHGVAKSRTQLSDFTLTFHFHALEKEMATHCSILAWRIPGTGDPGRLQSMGSHRVGHDWSDLVAAAVAGDWNAKVGSQETPVVTGKFGLEMRNEAEQRLIEFCQENALVIANTLFQQHERRLYTWTSPDGQHWNQTDYILCSQRWRSSI